MNVPRKFLVDRGPEITAALAAHGVAVVDCRSYVGLETRDLVRISIGSETQNRRLIAALQEIVMAVPFAERSCGRQQV